MYVWKGINNNNNNNNSSKDDGDRGMRVYQRFNRGQLSDKRVLLGHAACA